MTDESRDREHPEDFYERGIRELDAGNVEGAISAFEAAIRANPDDPRPYSNLGIAYELSNNYPKAREAYEKAIEINPRSTATMSNLAGLSLHEGNPGEAFSLYDDVFAADPLYLEPYLDIARFFMDARRFDLAEQYLRRALEIDSTHVEALNYMGIIKNLTERPAEAVAHFQDALRRDGNQASILCNLGIALRSTGDLKRSIIAFEKANELTPDTISILNNLGVLYRETGNTNRARDLFVLAIRLHPENPFPYFNLAELYISLGEYAPALSYLKQYIALVPLDLDNLYKTCGIARMADRLEDVAAEMESFIRECDPADHRVEVVRTWLGRVRGE